MAMAASLFPSGAIAALDTVDTSQEGKVAMVAPPLGSLGSNGSNGSSQPKVRREEKASQPAAVTPQAATTAAVSLRKGVGGSPHAPPVIALSALVAAACFPCPGGSVTRSFVLLRSASTPLSKTDKPHSEAEILVATQVLADYQQVGAVLPVSGEHATHWVPWFVISKAEHNTTKHRLISDCRELNHFFVPQNFRLDNLHQIFPYQKKGWWAANLDLKDAYFHLPLPDTLKRFLTMKVGDQFWEFQAGCFGLSIMQKVFMQFMGVLEKKWRKKGIICFIYLDDILVLGCLALQVQSHLAIIVQDLCQAGFKLNLPKCTLHPVQVLKHLGMVLDLQSGHLKVCPEKMKALRKELGKLLTTPLLTCRKMSAILGSTRSCLVALPF